MKNLDCNQIMIVINLEIIGEENKKKIISILILKNLFFFFFFCNLVKSFDANTASKPNFYYIVYDTQNHFTYKLSLFLPKLHSWIPPLMKLCMCMNSKRKS